MSTARSSDLYRRALKSIPGGVNSPVRAFGAMGRDPLFIASGSGSQIVDVDGNSYVDYVCSWGPLIAGHAKPEVVEAVQHAAAAGTSFGAPTEREVALAERVVERVPSADLVRLTSSGTEAAMTAVRLARAATGRTKLIKFAGAYHGHVDGLLVQAGSGLATHGIPASPGVTASQTDDTIVVGWNDRDGLTAAVDRYGSELAAVLAEPLPANMGVVPAADGFLELLRECCDACGALLVFDEVISGFRVAAGGVQQISGTSPDLTMLGKVLGGGLPLAAVAGRGDLMEQLSPAGDVYQAGTLSGNPLATAAGLATLELLDDDAYRALAATTERLASGLQTSAAARGVDVQVTSACGLLTLFLVDRPVVDYATAARAAAAYPAFFCGMLERGIYLPPSSYEAWFPSLAHTQDDVDRTIEAADAVFTELSN